MNIQYMVQLLYSIYNKYSSALCEHNTDYYINTLAHSGGDESLYIVPVRKIHMAVCVCVLFLLS